MAIDDREQRAAARRSWPIRRFRLGEEPQENLLATTTAAERIAMIWPMTVAAWALTGRQIPDYPRSEAPVRIIRPGDRRPGEDL
jgi:hypothetical protein